MSSGFRNYKRLINSVNNTTIWGSAKAAASIISEISTGSRSLGLHSSVITERPTTGKLK